jgi:DNA-dependent metalloprotease WSS1
LKQTCTDIKLISKVHLEAQFFKNYAMPLNSLRLNHQVSTHPNDRIVFIKPLPRPPSDQASFDLADTFLRAIAAQCLPIMKKHYLSVTTLEEYEPNPEFIGRNFNNGEVIQLVLRSKSGGWVPFNFVQMVMMHELAHNVHMNHGKGFWAERNKFSNELRELWAKAYTGEGFWGNGRTLESLQAVAGNNTMPSQELADLQVCGGTFRSRGRKRKRAGGQQDLTWKEKRDKRIEKKFGKNGQALGEDEGTRMMLEVGKGPVGGKPRVANSKRGRELRAAAALARFGTNKSEAESIKDEETGDGSEYEDEYDDVDVKGEDAKDINGQKLLDSMGFGMLRVCGDEHEDGNDVHVKQEMDDLMELGSARAGQAEPQDQSATRKHTRSKLRQPKTDSQQSGETDGEDAGAEPERNPIYDIPPYRGSPTISASSSRTLSSDRNHSRDRGSTTGKAAPTDVPPRPAATDPKPAPRTTTNCPICSMSNDRLNPTCTACAHVLDPKKAPRHWRCGSEVCQGSQYVNAGDCGVCGVCGTRRSTLGL